MVNLWKLQYNNITVIVAELELHFELLEKRRRSFECDLDFCLVEERQERSEGKKEEGNRKRTRRTEKKQMGSGPWPFIIQFRTAYEARGKIPL